LGYYFVEAIIFKTPRSYPRTTLAAIASAIGGGLAVAAVATFSVGGGTTIDKIVRTVATVDVASIAANSATSSNVTLTGASVGDECVVSVTAGDFLSTTSTGIVVCKISAADNALLIYRNVSSTAAFNAGASTFSVKATSF